MMNVTSFLTTTIAIITECLIVMYYSNSVMHYRYSRLWSNLTIVIGYVAYDIICMLGNPILNVLSGMIIMFVVLWLGFSENMGYIILRVLIIMLFSMFGEWIVLFFFKENTVTSFFDTISAIEDIVFTLTSKLILYIVVFALKHFSTRRYNVYKVHNTLYFFVLPVSTIFLLSRLGRVISELDTHNALFILLAVIAIIISNFIVYIVYDKMIENTEKMNQLQELRLKERIDYASYDLLKEKYDDLRIMIHNFEKYCANIEGMIDSRQSGAVEFVDEIRNKSKEFLLVEYTNNKALNILLSQKQKECMRENIDFQMYIQDVDLSFIKEIDIVSIFSNLLDNAIESCIDSSNKKIFLSIRIMNKSFIVVRVDNSCDTAPQTNNGKLRTHKQDRQQHGMGLLSVKKTLADYQGAVEWEYSSKNKCFSTIIMFNRSGKKREKMTDVVDF